MSVADARSDKYELRRKRLAELIAERFGGSNAKFARAIQRSDSYVSRMLSPPNNANSKLIGEDMVDVIEDALGIAGFFGTASPPLKGVAKEGRRTMNAEVVALLERAITSPTTEPTLRDQFAIAALPAVMQTAIERGARAVGGGPITEEVVAMQAYILADAMLAERAK